MCKRAAGWGEGDGKWLTGWEGGGDECGDGLMGNYMVLWGQCDREWDAMCVVRHPFVCA